MGTSTIQWDFVGASESFERYCQSLNANRKAHRTGLKSGSTLILTPRVQTRANFDKSRPQQSSQSVAAIARYARCFGGF
jgi:hypothetical protein